MKSDFINKNIHKQFHITEHRGEGVQKQFHFQTTNCVNFFYPYSLSCYHPHLFTDENNSLSTAIPDKPISLKLFIKLCEQRRKFPVLYKLEFQTAVKVETNSCKHANRRNNLEKNQNQKCIPYDYNRVVLEKIPGVADSDYINASYVDVRNLIEQPLNSGRFLLLTYFSPALHPLESPQTERVHCIARTYRGDCHRLLAPGLARKRQCDHNADQDVRLYKSHVRAILAGEQGKGRVVRRPMARHRQRGAVGQLPH